MRVVGRRVWTVSLVFEQAGLLLLSHMSCVTHVGHLPLFSTGGGGGERQTPVQEYAVAVYRTLLVGCCFCGRLPIFVPANLTNTIHCCCGHFHGSPLEQGGRRVDEMGRDGHQVGFFVGR